MTAVLMPNDPHDQERQNHAHYATHHAAPRYRLLERHAYAAWACFNRDLFDDRLKLPHIGFGFTPARTLCLFGDTTDHGAPVKMTLNVAFTFAQNRAWVAPGRDLTSEGFRRALDDLLLRMAARQSCLELHHLRSGDQGFTAALTQECNRVGLMLGLPRVLERRRGGDDDEPVVTGWPFCVRPDGYYLGDVTPAFLSLAVGGRRPSGAHRLPPCPDTYDYFLLLLATGQQERLRKIVERQRDLAEDLRLNRLPLLRRVEAGEVDVDGATPLPEVKVLPEWLQWQNCLVARMAEGIYLSRNFIDLPILGDALQDAGCDSEPLLRHLYARVEHTHRCWVLGLLRTK